MSSKKLLITPLAVSIIGHALILSATGLVDTRINKLERETAITLELAKSEAGKGKQAVRQESRQQARIAPEEREEESAAPEDTVSLNGDDVKYGSYLIKVKEKINNAWQYPHREFDRQAQGVATIKFSLNKQGRLLGVAVVKSSGFEGLDQGAVDAVRTAAPYEPFTLDISISKLNILADFSYRILE